MSTNETQVLPPPPPPTAPQPPYVPPLRRSTSDRMIGGVCGGLGRRYGIDPLVLRVVFVVAVLAGGVGLLVYLALWLLVPPDTDTSATTVTRSFIPLVVGVLLALGALTALVGWIGSLGGLAGVVVGAFLVGFAIWLYQRRETGLGGPGGYPTAAVVGTAPDPAWNPPSGFAYGGTGYAAPSGPIVAPAPPRPRSYLGLITLLAAFVVGAALTTAAALGAPSVGIVGIMAATLAVLAVGLLIGAFRGRARWLIIFALPLALLLGTVAQVASLLPAAQIEQGVGVRDWTPTAPADLRLGVGEAQLDLREWAASDDPQPTIGQTVSAEVGFGELQVIVPDTWQVRVNATTSAGGISVNGARIRSDGPTTSYDDTLAAVGDPTGRLALDLGVNVGDIRIIQRPVTPVVEPAPGRAPADRGSGGASAGDRPAGRDSGNGNGNGNGNTDNAKESR